MALFGGGVVASIVTSSPVSVSAGSIRYVIVKGHDITPAPTADDVAAASAGSSLTVVEAGAQAIPVALSTESLLSTALPASTAFTLFCVAEDGHTTPNRQSHVTAVGFTTAVDVTPPVIALGYPRVSEVSGTCRFVHCCGSGL